MLNDEQDITPVSFLSVNVFPTVFFGGWVASSGMAISFLQGKHILNIWELDWEGTLSEVATVTLEH